MSRKLPYIDIKNNLGNRYRNIFRDTALDILTDTFLVKLIPDEISLINGIFFQLVLKNKQFSIDTFQVDTMPDYVNVYLYNVVQPKERYNISVMGNDIIITFVEGITRIPADVVADDFRIEGKFKDII